VAHLGGDVDVIATALERVEIVGDGLPLPRQALVEHGAGQVLDPFHELDQRLAVARAHGREADAAVPAHHRGDTVARRRLQPLVPRGLPVVVGVDVDEAGGDDGAIGVDLSPALGLDRADLDDATAADGDVRRARCRTGPVNDGAGSDDEIERHPAS